MMDHQSSLAELIGWCRFQPLTPGWTHSLPWSSTLPKDAPEETLAAQFRALTAERERSWPPEQLARNIAQRQSLLDRFDQSRVIAVGHQLPDFELIELSGEHIQRSDLAMRRGHLLIFFRYAQCPACSIALPYYARRLWPGLAARDIGVIAISGQRPDLQRAVRDPATLPFRMASDTGHRLANTLGITFKPDDRPEPPAPGWVGELTGTGTWDLSQPTLIAVDRDAIVRWVSVSPDWLVRPEADVVLQALDTCLQASAR